MPSQRAARDRKPDKPRQCGKNQCNNFKSISALALRFSALRKDYGPWEIELSYKWVIESLILELIIEFPL